MMAMVMTYGLSVWYEPLLMACMDLWMNLRVCI